MGAEHSHGRNGLTRANTLHVNTNTKSSSTGNSPSRRISRAGSVTTKHLHQKPLSEKDKQLITDSWNRINADKDHLHNVLGTHWLHAAERCPMWIWGLIGIDEGDQNTAFQQPAFNTLITQIIFFVNRMVLTNELDMERNIEEALKLGQRHIEHFPEGFQQQYWTAFTLSLHDAITELVTEPMKASGTPKSAGSRLLMRASTQRVQALHTIRQQHKVTDAWHRMLSELLLAMKDGYAGELSAMRSERVSLRSGSSSNCGTAKGSPMPSHKPSSTSTHYDCEANQNQPED